MANAAKPDTILGWYRKLVGRKFDGSKRRRYPGRPRVNGEVEALVVHMARETCGSRMSHVIESIECLRRQVMLETMLHLFQFALWLLTSALRTSRRYSWKSATVGHGFSS